MSSSSTAPRSVYRLALGGSSRCGARRARSITWSAGPMGTSRSSFRGAPHTRFVLQVTEATEADYKVSGQMRMEPEHRIEGHRRELQEISRRHQSDERLALGHHDPPTVTRTMRSSPTSATRSSFGTGSGTRSPTSKDCSSTCVKPSLRVDHSRCFAKPRTRNEQQWCDADDAWSEERAGRTGPDRVGRRGAAGAVSGARRPLAMRFLDDVVDVNDYPAVPWRARAGDPQGGSRRDGAGGAVGRPRGCLRLRASGAPRCPNRA